MAKLPFPGERLLEGLIFFLIVKFCLACDFSADSATLNFDLYLGDSFSEFENPNGAEWFVLPELDVNKDTTDFPQFVKSDGDFSPFDFPFEFFLILNYLLLLSCLFSSIFSNDDSLEFGFFCYCL
jgi:hypothetical protein